MPSKTPDEWEAIAARKREIESSRMPDKNAQIMRLRHGNGPDNETCGTCRFFRVPEDASNSRLTCTKFRATNLGALVWRAKWPTCALYEGRQVREG